MHYLIFIPHKQAANQQHLIDAGLGDLLRPDDESPLCGDLIGPGPGDLPGQIWSWGGAVPAYLPDQQTWTAVKKGQFFFGVSNNSPPEAKEMMRRRPVDGLTHVMGDGNSWIIPSVFRLPAVFDIDEAGELTKKPHPRFNAFVDECNWALDNVLAGVVDLDQLDWKRGFQFVVMALAINYRVTWEIAVLLGIVEENAIPTLMAKATDADRVRKVMDDLNKKKAVLTPNG